MRAILVLIGLFFSGWLLVSSGFSIYGMITEPAEESVAHEFHKYPMGERFPSDGPLGQFKEAQLQRGFKVYREVCAACHGLKQVAFRNLADFGYNEDEIKAIAADWPIQVPSVDPDTGEASTRAALASDKFPDPFPNEVAARAANNNAVPPDLSLMTKARHGGADYVYSLLLGYRNPPANLPAENRPGTGLHYNPYFANLNIAMPPPLTSAGQVTYDDGTQATLPQMAKDVSAFMIWTAEPKLGQRKAAGWAVVIFLLIATVLAWFAYRNVWADKKH